VLRCQALFSFVLALAADAPAQQVNEPPPKIDFPAWKLETESETTVEYSISFQSAIVTAVPENNVVPLRIFLPKGKRPTPAVLVLHYLGARDLKVERALASRLNARGFAAAVMTLPYHLSRAAAGTSSGQFALADDPRALAARLAQSVSDARRSIDFLISRPEIDASRIGISGTSLGSIISALVFAVEPRLRSASFLLGGVDLAHIIWNSSRVVAVRDSMRRKGISEASLRLALQDVEPQNYLSKRTEGQTFVVGARYDTVMPPTDTEKLIKALKDPHVLWLETGHYGGILVQRKLLGEVSDFFQADFEGREFVAPKRVFAPTIRLGFVGSTGSSSAFDVGIGLDLFRSHSAHEVFGTALITPRGPQAYLGWHIDKGFSIGFIGGARRVGAGLMWSTIL